MKLYVYTMTQRCLWTDEWETKITGVTDKPVSYFKCKVIGNQIDAVKLIAPGCIDFSPEYVGPTSTYDRLRKDVIGDQKLVNDLIERNDKGWTFIEIADYLERDWNTDTHETVE